MNNAAESARKPILISIFHTNDMHGRLEAMARLSNFSRELREQAAARGHRVFFWDAGDAADRRIQICSATKCAAYPQILNGMGYSLQAMGNAILLTYGPQAMGEVAHRSQFPILAANCRNEDGSLLQGLKDAVLIPLADGVSIGVIGLTANVSGDYEIFGLRFIDFRQVTRQIVSQFQSEGVSSLIVLSHLGLDDDRRLADEVRGIDLIIGAHSHSMLPSGELRNGVLIAQAGQYAEAIGRIELAIDPDSGVIVSKDAEVFDVPIDTPADPTVLACIAAAEAEVKQILTQPVAEIAGNFDQDYFRECDVGNLAADALRERMKADIALVSSGQFQRGFEAGVLTLGQLDAACFSTANPWLSEVRGEQILEALERGLTPSLSENRHHAYRGAPVGIPQISGMQVRCDRSAAQAPRVRSVLVRGQPLDAGRLYRVAHTDAEAMAGIGYLRLESGQIIEQEVPTILSEVIADYLREHSPVTAPQRDRWIAV